ncbi:MAG TPA: hypothetical protein VHX39_21765, partial [Acetobacteraceae bacterium]|nr:hypothetical protein [Acetobacteraceae bacterium]
HGISRLPDVEDGKGIRRKFKSYPIGYFHIDIAEVRTAMGRLYLFVAVIFVAVCAVTTGGVLYVFAFMSGFGFCKTVVHRSIPSPDGNRSIVIFEKECGATVPFNTQASIAPVGSSFSPENSPPFFVISGRQDIFAGWRGNRIVEIAGGIPGGRIFKDDRRVGEIQVEYK